MKALLGLFTRFRRPGRIVLVLDGEEYTIRRTRTAGTMKLHVAEREIDAAWLGARYQPHTQPDGMISLQPVSRL